MHSYVCLCVLNCNTPPHSELVGGILVALGKQQAGEEGSNSMTADEVPWNGISSDRMMFHKLPVVWTLGRLPTSWSHTRHKPVLSVSSLTLEKHAVARNSSLAWLLLWRRWPWGHGDAESEAWPGEGIKLAELLVLSTSQVQPDHSGKRKRKAAKRSRDKDARH